MKAVVIAAGKGTRITSDDRLPKPLIPLLGVPLLARVILTALEAGLETVVVVVGYRAAEIRDGLAAALPPPVLDRVRYVENPRYEEANGLSILAAEDEIGSEDFLVLMADHLVEPAILRRLAAANPPPEGAILAVDGRIDDCPDLDDATKVEVIQDGETGRIVRIGKQLERYNAIDTGCFRMTSGIFAALREAEKRGNTSLSAGNQVLCEADRMRTLSVDGASWIDVDTPEMLPIAEARLLARLGKGRDGPVSRIFNRPVSLALTRRLARTGLSPDAATLIAFLFGAAGAALLAAGHFAAGGLLVHLHSVVDGIDGEIARLKHRGSYRGGWYDRLGDMAGEYAVFLGIALGTGSWNWAGAAFLVNVLYVASGDTLTALGLILGDRWRPGRTILPRVAPWVGRDVALFALTLLSLSGRPEIFFPLLVTARGAYVILQSMILGREMNRAAERGALS